MNTFVKIAGMAGFAFGASLMHKIEFSDQAMTFKRLASGEQISEVRVRPNVANAQSAEHFRESFENSSEEMEGIMEGTPEVGEPHTSGEEFNSEIHESAAENLSETIESMEQAEREENLTELFESQEEGRDGVSDSLLERSREARTESRRETPFTERPFPEENESTSFQESNNENIEGAAEGFSETLESWEQESREENLTELFESQEENGN